jgi:hypothetical protein
MKNKKTKSITVSELENELTNALNRLADGDIKRHKQSQKRKAEMALKEKNAEVVDLLNMIAEAEGVG